jgi:hypothetical protein
MFELSSKRALGIAVLEARHRFVDELAVDDFDVVILAEGVERFCGHEGRAELVIAAGFRLARGPRRAFHCAQARWKSWIRSLFGCAIDSRRSTDAPFTDVPAPQKP